MEWNSYDSSLPQNFKKNVLLDRGWVSEVSAHGTQDQLLVMEQFDKQAFNDLAFKHPFIVKNPASLNMRSPQQLFDNPVYIDSLGSKEHFQVEGCTAETYRSVGHAMVSRDQLAEWMRNQNPCANPFRAIIHTPPIVRRFWVPPRFADTDLLEGCFQDSFTRSRSQQPNTPFLEVCRKGMYTTFRTAPGGANIWIKQDEGSQMYFLVPWKPSRTSEMMLLSRNHDDPMPEVFRGEILMMELRAPCLLCIPGSWPHATLALSNSLASCGYIIATTTMPMHIRFMTSDDMLYRQEHTKRYPSLGRVLRFSLPMIISDVFQLSYNIPSFQEDPRAERRAFLEQIVRSYQEELGDQADPQLMYLLSQILPSQYLQKDVNNFAIHLSGGIFDCTALDALMKCPDFTDGITFSNVVVGKRWPDTLTSFEGRPDYFDGSADFEIQHSFTTKQWFQVRKDGHVRLNPGQLNQKVIAVAFRKLSSDAIVGELCGEVSADFNLKTRYGAGLPRGKIHFLRNIYTRSGEDLNFYCSVFIDANHVAGVNKYFEYSCNSNCHLELVTVGSSFKLAIVTSREIEEGERLVLPPLLNSDILPAYEPAISVTTTSDQSLITVAIPQLKIQSTDQTMQMTLPARSVALGKLSPPRDPQVEVLSTEYEVTILPDNYGLVSLTPRSVVVDSSKTPMGDNVVYNSSRDMRYLVQRLPNQDIRILAIKAESNLMQDPKQKSPPPPPSRGFPGRAPHAGPISLDSSSDIGKRRKGANQFDSVQSFVKWNEEQKVALDREDERFLCADPVCVGRTFSGAGPFNKHVDQWHVPYAYMCRWPGCDHGEATPFGMNRHYNRHFNWCEQFGLPIPEGHSRGSALTPQLRLPQNIPSSISHQRAKSTPRSPKKIQQPNKASSVLAPASPGLKSPTDASHTPRQPSTSSATGRASPLPGPSRGQPQHTLFEDEDDIEDAGGQQFRPVQVERKTPSRTATESSFPRITQNMMEKALATAKASSENKKNGRKATAKIKGLKGPSNTIVKPTPGNRDPASQNDQANLNLIPITDPESECTPSKPRVLGKKKQGITQRLVSAAFDLVEKSLGTTSKQGKSKKKVGTPYPKVVEVTKLESSSTEPEPSVMSNENSGPTTRTSTRLKTKGELKIPYGPQAFYTPRSNRTLEGKRDGLTQKLVAEAIRFAGFTTMLASEGASLDPPQRNTRQQGALSLETTAVPPGDPETPSSPAPSSRASTPESEDSNKNLNKQKRPAAYTVQRRE